jgi:exosortase B
MSQQPVAAAGMSRKNYVTAWWPALLGLAVLYIPTYYSLAHILWVASNTTQGLIVLAIILWLFWKYRREFLDAPDQPSTVNGLLLLIPGLLLYIIGRSQNIQIFEVGSQIPVLMGVILLCRGRMALKPYLFPILFLAFLVPLPGFIVDTITGTLKQYVSSIVEQVLYLGVYPIAHSGVTLAIGPYRLLVADACSGINTMFSLSTIGVLYLYLRAHDSYMYNALLLVSIVPIAFLANVGRVIILVLITYYFGDEVGQGFAHDFAGIVEFVIAMLVFLGIAGLLAILLPAGQRSVS